MQLARLAVIQLGGLYDSWEDFELRDGEAALKVLGDLGGTETERDLLVAAYVPLARRPDLNSDGFIVVPPDARHKAEQLVEASANRIAVLSGYGRRIYSMRQTVAFQTLSDSEMAWLKSTAGIEGLDRFVYVGTFEIRLGPDLLEHLEDRRDGVALLADVNSLPFRSDKFRTLIRVFERAFGCSSNRLVVHLSRFLQDRPGLSFTKSEVKHWITKQRGQAVHADRADLPVEADFFPAVPRMRFAAYDLLLNKLTWKDESVDRREIWKPTQAPSSAGGMISVQSQNFSVANQFLDWFRAYPLGVKWPKIHLSAGHWPTERPKKSMAESHLEVVGTDVFSTVGRPAANS